MRQRRSDKHKNKKSFNLYIILAAVCAVIIGITLAYTLSLKISTDKWSNKIYPGVTMEGIDLSGKTKEEAEDVINKELIPKIQNKKLNIKVGDNTFNYTYKDLEAKFDVEKCVQDALDYGKDKNIFSKNSMIKNKKGEVHKLEAEFNYNEDKITSIENELKSKVGTEAKDATISINGGKVTVVPDVKGYSLDDSAFIDKMKDSINKDVDIDTNISFNLTVTTASRTAEDLSKIKGVMGSFSTNYALGDRGSNLELVTNKLNGYILMPGEEFSYDKFTQSLRGQYKDAGGYINNKVEQVEGGGICQVCTTLYRAVMRANIRSVERHNHSLTVGYAKPGLDATVAWGYLDYKFKNTYNFPIYIQGIGGKGTITFNIYGDPAALGGNTYDLVDEQLGQDANGYTKAKSYQVTYKNGVEVSRELIATDTYAPHKES